MTQFKAIGASCILRSALDGMRVAGGMSAILLILLVVQAGAGEEQKKPPLKGYLGVKPTAVDENLQPDPLPCVSDDQASNKRPWKRAPKEWDEVLDYYTKNNIMPGAGFIISSPNWGTRFASSGVAFVEDKDNKMPDKKLELLPSSQFRIGSNTKVFISILMLQLDAEHKINFEDKVSEYLGHDILKEVHAVDEITLLQCLDMTSDLYSYTNEEYIGEVTADNAMYHFTPLQVLQIGMRGGTPATGQPGITTDGEHVVWVYTNTGYLLCGLIAEKLLGKPLHQLIKERITDKIGMTDTFLATDYRVTNRTVHGYTGFQEFGFWIDCTRYNQDVPWAAGAIVSTPFDMIRLYESLCTTEELMPKESRAKLLQMNYAAAHQGYGKAVLEELLPTGSCYGHGGTALGYLSAVFYYPEKQCSIFEFINTFNNKYTRAEVCYRILDYVFGACDEPAPANGAKAAKLEGGSIKLTWHAGIFYGDKHRVYLGTDEEAVMNATPEKHEGVQYAEVVGFEHEIKGLSSGKTYYWRVDAWRKRPQREIASEQDSINSNLGAEPSYKDRKPLAEQLLPGPVWSFIAE